MIEKDLLTEKVIGCAIEVHRGLGAGLLESSYQACLTHELTLKNLKFKTEVPLPIFYKGLKVGGGYRIDILVEDQLVLELKAVEEIKNIHLAQLLTYMKLGEFKTGLLISFNVSMLVDGVKRLSL